MWKFTTASRRARGFGARRWKESELINRISQFFFLLLLWKMKDVTSRRVFPVNCQISSRLYLSLSIIPWKGKYLGFFLFSPSTAWNPQRRKRKLALTSMIIIIPLPVSSAFQPGLIKTCRLLAGKKLHFNYTRLITDRVSRSETRPCVYRVFE